MLISLEEEKAKKLAQVISNETCTKLLNHLAQGKDGTETEIAQALRLPLSTVHYNLKQLVEARLVLADEYHYSSKGREVLHYKLANKYIIIAPQEEKESFLKKLQGFLPALFITVAVAVIAKVFMEFFANGAMSKAAESSLQTFGAVPAADGGARLMVAAAPAPVATPPLAFLSNEAILFFVAGACFIILLLAISAYVNRKR